MVRRKGERTPAINERECPHVVELPTKEGRVLPQMAEVAEWHRKHLVPLRWGTGRGGAARFCFEFSILAGAFRAAFGGQMVSPRGRE